MHPLVNLTKLAVESYIKENKIIKPPANLPKEFSRSEFAELLKRKAGTFVTIEKNGELRGCIGTYLPIRANIAEEIIHNAITAATRDFRFDPIQEKELPDLSYTVYILSEPELMKDLREFDPKKYGIIVRTAPIMSPDGTDVVFNGHFMAKTGLLLPDLEGVDTVKQQLAIACQKGGIDARREKIIIYRFTVEKYQ